eukprot:759825-Hanusia_phi.AAC.11
MFGGGVQRFVGQRGWGDRKKQLEGMVKGGVVLRGERYGRRWPEGVGERAYRGGWSAGAWVLWSVTGDDL